MGIMKKPNQSGLSKTYLTRTQSLTRLQLSLPDFRRLCILKGIHPHSLNSSTSRQKLSKAHQKAGRKTDPRQFGVSGGWYHIKDIRGLERDDLTKRLREEKGWMKRVKKAVGREEWDKAKELEKLKDENGVKGWRLDRVVKERYPTFPSLIPHLPDPLNLLSLFSSLPSSPSHHSHKPQKTSDLPNQNNNSTSTNQTSQNPQTSQNGDSSLSLSTSPSLTPLLSLSSLRLVSEFKAYVIRHKLLRKVFWSIKGVYWEVEIPTGGGGGVGGGERVRWVEGWGFVQTIPPDIDFRIMATFLEFYQTLLGFALYKLYTDAGLEYPPVFDPEADGGVLGGAEVIKLQERDQGLNLGLDNEKKPEKKMKVGDVKKEIKEISQKGLVPEEDDAPITESASTNEEAVDFPRAPDAPPSNSTNTALFASYAFYLSRETPLQVLGFMIRCFSGRVILPTTPSPGSKTPRTDPSQDPAITHYVVDRPNFTPPPGLAGRKIAYIQPQWIVDSINKSELLPTGDYAPDTTLPPHLSPFVDEDHDRSRGVYVPQETEASTSTLRNGDAMEEDEDDGDEEEVAETGTGDEMMGEDAEWGGIGSEQDADMHGGELEADEASRPSKDKSSQKAPQLVDLDDPAAIHAAELEAEARGLTFSQFQDEARRQKGEAKAEKKAKKSKQKANEEEKERQKEMAAMLLTGQKKRLYKKMAYTEKKNKEEREALEEKKKAINKAKKKKSKAG